MSNPKLAFVHIDEIPRNGCLVDVQGTPVMIIQLLLSGMEYSEDFAVAMFSACKFYSERQGKDMFEIMKKIKL